MDFYCGGPTQTCASLPDASGDAGHLLRQSFQLSGTIKRTAATRQAAFSAIWIFIALAAFGIESSSTPFLSVAVTFDVSTSAGKSIAR